MTHLNGQPCPLCGGNTRYKLWPKLGIYKCSVCFYQDNATAPATAAPARRALTPAETDQAHQSYTAAADYCAGVLWQFEGVLALDALHQRGFTDDTLRWAKIGYHPSTTSSPLGAALMAKGRDIYDGGQLGGLIGKQGRSLSLLQSAITLPYQDDGGTARLLRTRKLNPQPGKPKYCNPTGAVYAGGAPIFFGHQLLSDPKVSAVILTEGELKALAVMQAWRAGELNVPAIATPGGSYLPDELLDALSGKLVYLAYDVERRDNPFVPSAGEQFTIRAVEKLTGFKIQRAMQRLSAQHERAIKAKDSNEIARLQAKIDQVQAQHDVIDQRAIRVKVIRLPLGDSTKIDLDSFLLAHGPAALQALIDRAADASAWYAVHGDIPYRYDLASGRILNGTRQMANYLARVIEDVTVCDGLSESATYRIALRAPGGQERDIIVPADEWSDARKAMERVRAGLLSGSWDDEGRDTFKAIRLLSRHGGDPLTRTSFTCTGWQQIGGHWHYLMPDGAITGSDIVTTVRAEVDPKAQGNHYALCGPGDAQRGAAAYLSFLRGEICPQPLALLLAAHAALPLIHRFLATDGRPLVFPFGESGSLKSALARAGLLALYGPTFTAERTDGGATPKWDSTYNGLEQLAFTYRDAPLLIDDYKQATAGRDALPRFLHAYSESSSRTRSTKYRSLDRTFPARCIAVVTGEDQPGGDVGQIGRCLFVAIRPGEVQPEPLAALQRAGAAGHLAAFWRGLVQEIARWLDRRGADGVHAILQNQLDQDDAALPGHLRTAGALRQNRAAWLVLSHWLVRAGYLSTDEAAQLDQAHLDARTLVVTEQQRTHAENRPATIFLNVLREGIATSQVRIAYESESTDKAAIEDSPAQHATVVGFHHTAGVALFPEAAYRFVQDWRSRQRQPLNYSAAAIWQQLDSDGVLVRTDKARAPKYKIRYRGGTVWCLMLTADAFAGVEPPDEVPKVPAGSQSSQKAGTATDGTTTGEVRPVPKVPNGSEDSLHGGKQSEDRVGKSSGNNGNNGNNGSSPHPNANGAVPHYGQVVGTAGTSPPEATETIEL